MGGCKPLTCSDGIARSTKEKTIQNLCRDIIQPNHDRGYRSLAFFLAPFLPSHELRLRVFDVLHSGSGDAALQINAIGNMGDGEKSGFLDILAPNGHARWLQPGIETAQCSWRDWLSSIADFYVVFPILGLRQLLGECRGTPGNMPWLTCRQRRRKEKTHLSQSPFNHSAKLTKKIGPDQSSWKTPTRADTLMPTPHCLAM